MIVKSCKFVEATEVFKDCPKAWDVFFNGSPDCSWGDNNRTMVTPDVISNCIRASDYDDGDELQVKKVLKRLESIEPNTYVDLEN